MFKKIFFLLLINFLDLPILINAMEESKPESSSLEISSLPIELITYMFVNVIKDIVNDSNDIFDAHTKLTESQVIKSVISINKSFKSLLKELRNQFVLLMNEKFPNFFLDKTLEEKNEFLRKLFNAQSAIEDIDPENEILAAQAILAGADVDLKVGLNPVTPILISTITTGYTKFTKFLIEHGANLNMSNKQGYTPLLMAIRAKYPDIVELLLENGANPNITDNSGLTPLMLAVHYNNLNMVNALLRYKAEPRAVSIDGDTALKIAKKLKLKPIKKLLKKSLRQYKAKKCRIA